MVDTINIPGASSSVSPTDIAIIGMSGRFPGANTIEQFWQNLQNGVESISFFTLQELEKAGVPPELAQHPDYVPARGKLAGADSFDASFFGFSPKEAAITDPQHRVFLECAWEALENAGCDSARYEGPIGVFAGTGTNHYQQRVLSNGPLLADVGQVQAGIGNEVDFIANRVSYKLNLKGPGVAVQSACSTSLVAVHLACLNLINYECDLALAGGVSIRLPQQTGYLYQSGGIMSPDGHCRAFDAAANGTVSSNGAGAVALKRLADALDDGDFIYAVIKGTAVNNDGALKVGYTAPSVAGQAEVIVAAQAMAEVNPASIGYIEAHGTGTRLGDPVEIAALTQAFHTGTAAKNFCAIGSVKTNLGHLNTAAGIAGLIKTVLMLTHRQIPPTLHFNRPNPEMDLENSPFFVNTALQHWQTGNAPRRAGVSSFGLGGTNAHAILEEAPARPTASHNNLGCVLPLSAKTESALNIMTRNLADYLLQRPDQNLADVAWTLQTGRQAFKYRRVIVSRDTAEAATLLENPTAAQIFSGIAADTTRPIIFLFSGVGDHYVDMGLGLYRNEPTFRHWVDDCARILEPHLAQDLRQTLYPSLYSNAVATDEQSAELDLRQMLFGRPTDPAAEKLNQIQRTHAALFTVEYALAQLLLEWGLKPAAMLGHSLGEYVAACLSGLFSLEEALALIVRRARLIESLPTGAMLAVPLSEAEIAPRLSDDISLALINSPDLTVLTGPEEAIVRLETQLNADDIICRRVQNTRPLHSPLMESIAAPLTEIVSRIPLNQPQIPFISNTTGDWITPAQATDPAYWSQHLCRPVRFADGLQTIWQKHPTAVLIEIGPGQTLTVLARQHPAGESTAEPVALPTMRPAYDHRLDDTAFLLMATGRLWLTGYPLNWDGIHRRELRRRVPLPTYPFERKRYWVETPAPPGGPPGKIIIGEQSAGNLTAPLSASPPDVPHTAAEQLIIRIWQDLLGVTQANKDDNFMELGGHSLLAIQLAARLSRAFNRLFPLDTLLQAPTVAAQAKLASQLQTEAATMPESLPVITPNPQQRHLPFPLTEVQEAYWVGRSGDFELGQVSTHGYAEIDIELTPPEFEQAWQRLIDRHDMLRLIILPDGQQQILGNVPPYAIETTNLRGHSPETIAARIEPVRQRMSHEIRPLEQWPLFEIQAFWLTDRRTRFCLSFDLITGDAGSWQLIFRELKQLCQNPNLQLPSLELSFRDYVLAERALRDSALYRRAWAYWQARLSGLPPAPQLPLVQTPATIIEPHFKRLTARLEPDIWRQLKKQAGQLHLTSSGVLLAAFAKVLETWSKSPQFTLNLTIFNRLPLHPQVDDIAGDFTSLILLAVDNSRPDTFVTQAQNLQRQLWQDLEHRSVTGVRVLRELIRQQGGKPGAVMPVVFTSTLGLGQTGQDASVLGQLARLGDIVYAISQTPQVWLDHQVFEQEGALVFNWDAITELFPAGVLEDMFEAYRGLLHRLAVEPDSWQETSLSLIPPTQRERHAALNETSGPLPEKLAHSLFIEQVSRRPNQPAVIASTQTLTYAELYRRANQLGRYLRQVGAQPDTLVAVVMEKGWEQIVAVLGILQAGAAYVPIDPANPPERLHYLLEHSRATFLLTQSRLNETLTWPLTIRRLTVNDNPLLTHLDDAPLPAVQTPDNLAYVLYTSGSTGPPKGVMIEHRSLVNRILDVNARFGVQSQDRAIAITALHHDLSGYDIFGLLGAGGTLVVPDAAGARDPAHWLTLMNREKVTLWNSVPAFMEMLVEYMAHLAADAPERLPQSLRLALLSGDWIPVSLPDRLKYHLPQARIISLGGPTETTIWDICYPIDTVDSTWWSIPYGQPMTNAQYYVLHDSLEPCPDWVTGELYIGGAGLARGYWQDEPKTQAKFIHHPHLGQRLYCSGDLGRYRPDGLIEILGRKDFQLKIRGHRIEAGEIEAALLAHPMLKEAVVVAAGSAGQKRLVAYLVVSSPPSPTDAELLRFLQQKLPDYMIPSAFVYLDTLPLTANGKVNRRALPEPSTPPASAKTDAPRNNRLTAQVTQMIAGIINVENPGADDDLLMMGATSVDMIRIANALDKELGFRPKIDELYNRPTPAGLVALYLQHRQSQHPFSPAPAPTLSVGMEVVPADFNLLLDPDERDAFRATRPGLRQDDGERPGVQLTPDPPDETMRQAYLSRSSRRRFLLNPIPLTRLDKLLSHLRQIAIDGTPKYRYPSAGGLYPVQTYLYVKPGRVTELETGVYYYHPVQHRLVSITPRVELDRTVYSRLINRPIFDEAAFAVFFISQIKAIAPMYGSHSLTFSVLEAGYMGQLLMTHAADCEVGLCAIGDLEFERIRPLFELDDTHTLVHSMLGGRIDPDADINAVAEQNIELQGNDKMARILTRIKDLSPVEVETLLRANKPPTDLED